MHHLQLYHSWTKFPVILRQWISGEHQRNLVVPAVPNMPPTGPVEHYCPSNHELLPMPVVMFRGIQRGSNEVNKLLLQLLHLFCLLIHYY